MLFDKNNKIKDVRNHKSAHTWWVMPSRCMIVRALRGCLASGVMVRVSIQQKNRLCFLAYYPSTFLGGATFILHVERWILCNSSFYRHPGRMRAKHFWRRPKRRVLMLSSAFASLIRNGCRNNPKERRTSSYEYRAYGANIIIRMLNVVVDNYFRPFWLSYQQE